MKEIATWINVLLRLHTLCYVWLVCSSHSYQSLYSASLKLICENFIGVLLHLREKKREENLFVQDVNGNRNNREKGMVTTFNTKCLQSSLNPKNWQIHMAIWWMNYLHKVVFRLLIRRWQWIFPIEWNTLNGRKWQSILHNYIHETSTFASKINAIPQGCSLSHFEAALDFSRSEFTCLHNNISQICYWGQISVQCAAVKCSFSDYLTPLKVTFILLVMVPSDVPQKNLLSKKHVFFSSKKGNKNNKQLFYISVTESLFFSCLMSHVYFAMITLHKNTSTGF